MKPKHAIWILVALLLVLHQDNWYWDDSTLVFGFLPIGLLYHACLSMAAAIVWYLATKFAWPEQHERAGPAGAGSAGDGKASDGQEGGSA